MIRGGQIRSHKTKKYRIKTKQNLDRKIRQKRIRQHMEKNSLKMRFPSSAQSLLSQPLLCVKEQILLLKDARTVFSGVTVMRM